MASLLKHHELLCAAGGVVVGAAACYAVQALKCAASAGKGKRVAVVLAGCGVFDGCECGDAHALAAAPPWD